MSESLRDRVAVVLRQHGPQDLHQLMAEVGATRMQVANALFRLHIKKQNGVYAMPIVPDVVPARQMNVFASPGLSAQYQISALGKREGSNDHLQYRSKHV